VKTLRAERKCRVQKKITELHRTSDSVVNFVPGEKVPHFGSGAAHGSATCVMRTSGTAAIGNRRDSAGYEQKGNNGSRRPHIKPQGASSWINRSRGVKPSRSVKVPSEQSVKQVIYEGATTKRVVGSSAVESTQGARSPRRDVRD